MQTRTADDGAFVMEWYAPAAVTALGMSNIKLAATPIRHLPVVLRRKTAAKPSR